MLGTAQADALSAEVARVGGVFACVGVGANAKLALANHIGPLKDGVELGWWLGSRQLHCANNHFAGGAVEADDIAFFDNNSADGELLAIDLDGVGTHDCRRTPTACHNGCVTHQATASGEDALADHHAVHVFGAGFATNEDDLFATLVGLHCVVSGEVDPAHSSTWRRSETLGERLALVSELRMQHLIEMLGCDAGDGLGAADLPALIALAGALGHVDGHLQCSSTGALADTGLQHPQLALLDGELGVAHVGVMTLETLEDGHQLGMKHWEVTLHVIEIFGVANTGNNIFALGVDEEVAVWLVLASGCVAGEADAGAAVLVAVTEHHDLHVYCGAEFVANALTNAIGNRASSVPAGEHGLNRATQLLHGILRECFAGGLFYDGLIRLTQRLERCCWDLGIGLDACSLLRSFELVFERLARHVEHDAAVHRNEATVAVVGEALVAGHAGQTLDALVVETKVQDGVHHARHRELGARANAHEQRIVGIAEIALHRCFELGHLRGDLGIEALRPAAMHVCTAGVGADGETRRHRQFQDTGHLSEVGTLSTKEVFVLHGGTAMFVGESVDIRHGH